MSTVDDVRSLEQLADDVPTKFPSAPYANTSSYFDAYAQETARAARSIEPAALDRAAAVLLKAYAGGAGVFSCGNGGSAAVANHLQCDHLKTVRTIANDIGYDDVFAYQLQSQSRPGDVLIAVSSSGRSANIVNALTWARDHDVGTIALTGFDGGIAKVIADVCVHVEGTNYGIVEDLHQAIMHALAQSIRQSRMSEEAILSSVF
jgi:D-sedoheptulose 7-phosphate isomerase/D-glycero-D-manno-heptose 1,7-bisphosphate phosphatase